MNDELNVTSMAEKAIRELQINIDRELIINAIEKQTPKQPINCHCPSCNTDLDVWNYCPVCGQKLDWNAR